MRIESKSELLLEENHGQALSRALVDLAQEGQALLLGDTRGTETPSRAGGMLFRVGTISPDPEQTVDLTFTALATADVPPERPRLGSDIPIYESSKIIAKEGSIVHANRGFIVYAEAGSTVYAESDSRVYAESGATIFAHAGSEITLGDKTSVNAKVGPTIHQEKGSAILVGVGAKVAAYDGAVVIARDGEVTALSGSTIYAQGVYDEPTQVNPLGFEYSHPTIHAAGDCSIYAGRGAVIDIAKGIKVETQHWDGAAPVAGKSLSQLHVLSSKR